MMLYKEYLDTFMLEGIWLVMIRTNVQGNMARGCIAILSRLVAVNAFVC